MKTKKQISQDFINSIEKIKPQEFFDFEDLFKVKEVHDNIIQTESLMFETGYSKLPRKGYRYLYFPLMSDSGLEFDYSAFKEIKKQLEWKNFIIISDEDYTYIGVPESDFKDEYVSKFIYNFED